LYQRRPLYSLQFGSSCGFRCREEDVLPRDQNCSNSVLVFFVKEARTVLLLEKNQRNSIKLTIFYERSSSTSSAVFSPEIHIKLHMNLHLAISCLLFYSIKLQLLSLSPHFHNCFLHVRPLYVSYHMTLSCSLHFP